MSTELALAHPYEPKFVLEDLPFNRHGALSPRQKNGMHADSRGCLTRLIIVDALALAFLVIGTKIGGSLGEGILALPAAVLFITVPFLIIALMPNPKSLYIVKKAEGKAQLTLSYGKGNAKYHVVVVDKIDFRVSAGLFSDLENGDLIAIYYTASSARHSIISWERLNRGS